jgi:uncharacterized protein (TIGR03435 family)
MKSLFSLLVVAGFVCACTALSAQEEHFDAASIKPNTAGATSMLWAYQGRRFTARYAVLKDLIAAAYGAQERALTPSQISGGPQWIESDRFDVVATAPGVSDSLRGTFPSQVLAMLRSLLEDRCRLTTHVEIKELPVFALVLARSDARLGPRLRRRTFDCISAAAAASGGDAVNRVPLARRTCGGNIGPGVMTGNGVTMTNLATALARLVPGIDRVVVDHTGLSGTFDVDLTWRYEPTPEQAPLLPPPDRNAASLFTALQEQLGLKLESTKAPVDVLVIDHVERPSPD